MHLSFFHQDKKGVLSDPDMIEKPSSVRKQQTETAGKVVLDNMSKAKETNFKPTTKKENLIKYMLGLEC